MANTPADKENQKNMANALATGNPDKVPEGPEKSYRLISGIHQDKDGVHFPGNNDIIKSTKDLVAIHGSDRFVALG